jgi:hypothetical protein
VEGRLMTRARIFGEGSEFGEWLRRQESIPSSKVVASDCDFMIHRHTTDVGERGTREVQSLMILEVKTRNGEPQWSQLDTMWANHLCANTREPRRTIRHQNKKLFHEGVSFVSLSGTTPENSNLIRWGRFGSAAKINWTPVSSCQLLQLLRFELDLDTLKPRPYRSHHASRSVIEIQETALGFSIPVVVTFKS